VFDIDRWLAVNSRPDAVVISAVGPLVYLGIRRKSIRAFDVDPLPIFYGIPLSIDAGAEFSRVMRTYKPDYIVQLQPDFFASALSGNLPKRRWRAGFIKPAFASGHFQIYRVIEPDLGLPAPAENRCDCNTADRNTTLPPVLRKAAAARP